jgi:subtilase family serine protease
MLPVENSQYTRFRSSLGTIAHSVLGILMAVVAVVPGQAQQKVPPNPARITAAIDDSVLTTLKGNIHPLAQPQNDRGAAPVSQPMNHVQLVLQRSTAQEAALETYLTNVQIKSSPSYHKWLTPQQFGELYGPNEADIQTLTVWLTNHGFTVNKVANGRTFIDFSGSVAQVQSAFHTSIHNYEANGVSFYANKSNPQVPSAIAAVVTGVTHLNNIPLKPLLVKGSALKYDSQKHHFTPLTSAAGSHAEYTVDLSGYPYLAVVPADAATIYDTPNSTLNSKFSGTTSYTGTGVTIGIMGQSSIDPTLVQSYRTLFLGNNTAPIISNLDGVGDVSGDDDESYLDLEISGGLAPGATIHFYTASATTDDGVLTSAQYAVDTDNTIDVLSLSYGSCELDNGTSGNASVNSLWEQAAAQGITVVVATGDTGSAGCDAATDSAGDNTATATGPLAVNGLASTPYDIAVGGTDYDVLETGTFTDYVSDSTEGSAPYYGTALGYIPEATWNDSTYNNTTISDNVYIDSVTGDTSDDNISGGSGGPSNCAVNTTTDTTLGTCTSGYPKPSWQTGTGVPNDQARDIPDVSFLAGNGFYGALWATCDNSTDGFDADGNTGTATCVANSSGDFYTDGVGGTSAATPTFAGIMALIVQKTGQRQGAANSILYGLFNSTPSVFHDVTLGNNSVPCTPTATTTATCVENSESYDFESGYNTNAGYDLATGLGSVDATLLVNNWTSATGSLDVAEVAATPSATTISVADPLTFTISVAALATGGAVPAGTVSVTDGTYTAPTPTALVNGAATITIPANSLVVDSADTFTINYTPATGSTFAHASTFVVVAITSTTPPVGTFTIASPAVAVTAGATTGNTSALTITPAGGYVGTVNLSCALASSPSTANASYNPACVISPTGVAISGTTAGAATATVSTTTRSTSGSLIYPKTNRWSAAAGGAALACVLFFGIPARRRGWRSMLALLVFLVGMAGIGCGGSSTPAVTIGTTAGTYTFTVTGTDSVTSTTTATSTITVTVN